MSSINTEIIQEGQLVTFRLGSGTFGIEINKVLEVINLPEIIHIPNAPDFMEGIVNLRDKVIPVMDIKKRLNTKGEYDAKKRIVVLEIEDRPLGIIVDAISGVQYFKESNIESVPASIVDEMDKSCISKLAKINDKLIIIISPENILNGDSIRSFKELMN